MSKYRDEVDWQKAELAEGDEVPSYYTMQTGIPGRLRATRGAEMWHPRQLEVQIDYVFETWLDDDLATATEADQLVVTDGIFIGKVLNIIWTKPIDQDGGRRAKLEFYCRENQHQPAA